MLTFGWFDTPHPHLSSRTRFADLSASARLFQQPHGPDFVCLVPRCFSRTGVE